ncbi:hypothetical protein JTB14_020478 [Gonioctena quinquepunctata]|nr:hypothetical protein JTB14_020478 [Gonioctena quinquepunctata]
MNVLKSKNTDRKIASVKWMNDEGLVAHVDDPADPVASVKGCRSSRVVLHCPMVITMFYVLQKNKDLKYRLIEVGDAFKWKT